MVDEPVACQHRHLLERARFLEKVGGAGDHGNLALDRDRRLCLPVELKDHLVAFTHYQQGRSVHLAQRFARKIGPPGAGYHRRYLDTGMCGRSHGRARTDTGTEVTDRQ